MDILPKKDLLIVPVGHGDRHLELLERLKHARPQAEIEAVGGLLSMLAEAGAYRFSMVVFVANGHYSLRLAAFEGLLTRAGYKTDDLYLWRAGEPNLAERNGFGRVFLHGEIDRLADELIARLDAPKEG